MIGPSFVTKYGGRCGRCGKSFEAGALAAYEDGVLILDGDDHDDECLAPVEDDIGRPPPASAVCRHCFLVHAGECF